MDAASLCAFIRLEADLSDEKAKRLRAQADMLAQQHGISEVMEAAFDLNPTELAPLDEFGVPKYKGRKRGRKPKKRKRAPNPNRRKRQHTAYTLFVQENYPIVRAQYPDYFSKDIIGMVARQWATVPDAEKAVWKERAVETHDEDEEEEDDEEEEEEDDGDDEEEEGDVEAEGQAPVVRKRGRPKKKV